MTVKELQEELSKYPDDMEIVIDGYEGGVDDMGCIKEIEIVRDVCSSDYFGPHEIVMGSFDDYEDQQRYSVLYFPR